MNTYKKPRPASTVEPAAATLCGSDLIGRAELRRILTRLGFCADESQEDVLLELIQRSKRHALPRPNGYQS